MDEDGRMSAHPSSELIHLGPLPYRAYVAIAGPVQGLRGVRRACEHVRYFQFALTLCCSIIIINVPGHLQCSIVLQTCF